MVDNFDHTVTSGETPSRPTKVDPMIGTVLAERYRIEEMVGRGGMGVVYRAVHVLMERTVAVKMLLPQMMESTNAVPRFQREARAASRINHKNIMGLHDFGVTDDDVPYLVLDFIQGESLADVIKRDGQLSVARALPIFIQVCDALAHAHDLGVIHRDLKPGNIMLVQNPGESDVVKVVDFGVAKMYELEDEADMQRLTATGEIFGSPVYMSPEQCMGEKLDPRSDIYAMGCVMYETLTGKLPLCGRTIMDTISKQMNTMPPPFAEVRSDLFIPPWLEGTIFKALQKDRDARQQTMRELKEELEQAGAGQRGSATAAPAAAPAASNKVALSVVALLIAAGAIAGGFWFATTKGTITNTAAPRPAKDETAQVENAPAAEITQDSASAGAPTDGANDNATPLTSGQKNAKFSDNTEIAVPESHEQVAKPAKAKASQPTTPSRHVSKNDTPEPVAPEAAEIKKRSPDYYDYASHEHADYGDPQSLPVKDWSGQ